MASNFFKIAKGVTLAPQTGADPTGTNGDIYYNSSLGKFRKFENGAWSDFAGSSGSLEPEPIAALNELGLAELNALVSDTPNQIVDAFLNDSSGTKSNLIASASALRFVPAQLSGTYNRKMSSSLKCARVTGVAVTTPQALAPKNGQTVPMNNASQAIVFSGDVTNLFANTKKVLIAKKLVPGDTYADGKNRYQFIGDEAGDYVNQFAVSGAPSYNSGTDETTITITNLSTPVDLASGVVTGSLNSGMRVIPWDYQYKVRSKASSSLETMPIKDAALSDVVRLAGEAPSREITSLANSAKTIEAVFSDNKQYGVYRVLKEVSGSDDFEWFYTADAGKTWASLGTRTANTSFNPDAADGTYWHHNRLQIFVTNDGKMVSVYYRLNNSGVQSVYGVYANLSSGTPSSTFTDLPDSTLGDALPTAGRIQASSSGAFYGVSNLGVTATPDGNAWWINVQLPAQSGVSHMIRYVWTASTPTYGGIVSSPFNLGNSANGRIFGMGSGAGNRKVGVAYVNTSGNFAYARFTEADATEANNGISGNGNDQCLDAVFSATDNKCYIMSARTNGALTGIIVTNAYSGTISSASVNPMPSSTLGINFQTSSQYNGTSENLEYGHLNKTAFTKMKMNPSNNKHILMAIEGRHVNVHDRTHLFEFTDFTAAQGPVFSQYSVPSVEGLNNTATSNQKLAQTFTASATRVRTVCLRVKRIGTIAAGYTLSCSIYNTSGGAPTTVIATSDVTYDPSMLSSTDDQLLYFTFDHASLASMTGVYAFVFETTQPLDTTNYIQTYRAGSVFGGGSFYKYNGTSWSDTGNDMAFEIHPEWINDITPVATSNGATNNGEPNHVSESSIEFITSGGSQLTHACRMSKRDPSGAAAHYDNSGVPYRRVITFGGANKSVISASSVAGYQSGSYDPNLIFSVAHGATASKKIDTITGAVNDAAAGEDRSGTFNVSTAYTNIVSSDYVTDASFEQGKALNCIASEYTVYQDAGQIRFDTSKDSVIEAEIKDLGSAGTNRIILGMGSTWAIGINSSNFLYFYTSSGTTTASDVTETTAYHKIRMVYTASNRTVRLYRSTGAPFTTFTEVATYSSQTILPAATIYGSGNSFYNGTENGTSNFNGKIGYVKYAKGTTTFAYNGYRDQSGLVQMQNMGHMLIAKKAWGFNSTTKDQTYYDPMIITPDASQSAVVDSPDVIVNFEHTIAGTTGNELEFELAAGRVSARDQSSVQGINLKFAK